MVKKTEDFNIDWGNNSPIDDFGSLYQDKGKGGFDRIKDFAKGFISGSVSSIGNPTDAAEIVNKTMPRGYGKAVTDAMELGSGVKELYDEVQSQYGQISDPLKRTVGRAAEQYEKYLPKGFAKRAKRWGSTANQFHHTKSESQIQNEQLSQTLEEIFGVQSIQQAQSDARADARESVRIGLESKHRIRVFNQGERIESSLNRLVAYQDRVASPFQRKMLEVQIKQYYIQAKTLETIQNTQRIQTEAFRVLTSEIQKPDILKLRTHKETRNVYGEAGEREAGMSFFGSRGAEFQRIRENMVREGREAMQQIVFNTRQMLGLADMGMMAGSMGGGGSSFRTAGSMVGSFAPSIIANLFGDKIKSRLDKNPRLRRGGANAQFIAENFRPWLNKQAKGDGLASPLAGILSNLLQDDRSRLSVKEDTISSINQPVAYRRQDSKALTEVIPGYLARILQVVTSIRTGSDAPLIKYDYNANKFAERGSVAKNVIKSMINRDGGQWVRDDVYNLIDTIGGGDKLDRETRYNLARQLLSDNYNKQMPSRERLTKAESFNKLTPEQAKVVSNMFRKHFRGDNYREKELEFSSQYNQLGANLRSNQASIQDHVTSGLSDYLSEEGVIKGGRIQPDRLFELYLNTTDAGLPKEEKDTTYFDLTKKFVGNIDQKYGVSEKFGRRKKGAKDWTRRTAVRAKRKVRSNAEIARRLIEKEESIRNLRNMRDSILARGSQTMDDIKDSEQVQDLLDMINHVDPRTEEGEQTIKSIQSFIDSTREQAGEIASREALNSYGSSIRRFANKAGNAIRNPKATFEAVRDKVKGINTDKIREKATSMGRGVSDRGQSYLSQISSAGGAAADKAGKFIDPVALSIDDMKDEMSEKLDETVTVLKKLLNIDEEREEREKGPRRGSFEDLANRKEQRRQEKLNKMNTRSDAEDSGLFSNLFGNLFGLGNIGEKIKGMLGFDGAAGIGDIAEGIMDRFEGRDIERENRRGRRGARGRRGGRFARAARGIGGRFSASPGGFAGGAQNAGRFGAFKQGYGAGKGAQRLGGNTLRAGKNLGSRLNIFTGGGLKRAAKNLFSRNTLRAGYSAGKAGMKGVGKFIRGSALLGKGMDSTFWRLAKFGGRMALRTALFSAGAVASVLTSPVALTGMAIAGVGAAGYGLFKYFTRPKLGDVSTYRYAQYGFAPEDEDNYKKIFALEKVLTPFLAFTEDGIARLKKGIDPSAVFGALEIDVNKGDEDGAARLQDWLGGRFMPVFLLNVSVLSKVAKTTDLQKVDKLNLEEKVKYLEGVRFESGPYDILTNPFSEDNRLVMDKDKVAAVYDDLFNKVKEKLGPAKTQAAMLGPMSDPKDTLHKVDILDKDGKPISDAEKAALLQQGAQMGIKPTNVNTPEELEKLARLGGYTVGAVNVAGSVTLPTTRDPSIISAVDAVRYKAYGLDEMNLPKVRNLQEAEQHAFTRMQVVDSSTVQYQGPLEAALTTLGPSFGVTDLSGPMGREWIEWFNFRFLPVYSRAASLMYQYRKTMEVDQVVNRLSASERLEVANQTASTMSVNKDGETTSIWLLTATPWPGVKVNTDVMSVVPNLDALKKEVAEVNVPQTQVKKDEQDKYKPYQQQNIKPGDPDYDQGGANFGAMYGGANAGGQGLGLPGANFNPATGAGIPGGNLSIPSMAGAQIGQGTGGAYTTIPDATGKQGYQAFKDLIAGAAQMSGVSEVDLATFIGLESTYNNNAKPGTSSAKGLGQFIDSTWEATLKAYGGKYGIPAGTSVYDPRANALMTAEYMKENYGVLKRAFPNRNISMLDLYFAHFLGPGGVQTFIKAKPDELGKDVLPKAAKANPWVFSDKDTKRPRTIAEIWQSVANRASSIQSKQMGITPTVNSGQGVQIGQGTGGAGTPGLNTQTAGISNDIGAAVLGANTAGGGLQSSSVPIGGTSHQVMTESEDDPSVSAPVNTAVANATPVTEPSPAPAPSAAPVTVPTAPAAPAAPAKPKEPEMPVTVRYERQEFLPKGITGELTTPDGKKILTLENVNYPSPGIYKAELKVTKTKVASYLLTHEGTGENLIIHMGDGSNDLQPTPMMGMLLGMGYRDETDGEDQIKINSVRAGFLILHGKAGEKFRIEIKGGDMKKEIKKVEEPVPEPTPAPVAKPDPKPEPVVQATPSTTPTPAPAASKAPAAPTVVPTPPTSTLRQSTGPSLSNGAPVGMGSQTAMSGFAHQQQQQISSKVRVDQDAHLTELVRNTDLQEQQLDKLTSMNMTLDDIRKLLTQSNEKIIEALSKNPSSGGSLIAPQSSGGGSSSPRQRSPVPEPVVSTARGL